MAENSNDFLNKVWNKITDVTSTFLLGDLKQKIATKKDIGPLSKSIQNLNHAVIEIQTSLRSAWQGFDFKQQIKPYITTLSPITLNETFKPYITNVGLDKQIEKQKKRLTTWLKKHKPSTGIDAQDKIDRLVLSGEIERYLDLKEYKTNLYKNGKSSMDASGILAVYLYEVLIPLVIK